MVREEIIKPLSAEEYEILLRMTEGRAPIVKDHRTYAYDKYTLEFSTVDEGAEHGFSYAEVEFPTPEEAMAFEPPEWFGEETTEQKGVRMKGYWSKTRL